MKCPKVRLYLVEYQSGRVKARLAARIERHLRYCPDCAGHFAAEKGFSGVLEQAFAGDEDFRAHVDRMWGQIEARIRTREIESDSISLVFFRRAMAYSCGLLVLLVVSAVYVGRERIPATVPSPALASCFRTISPGSDSQYERETLKLLNSDVYSIEEMSSFLSEMKRPTRSDLFTECYPQLPAVHAKSDHL